MLSDEAARARPRFDLTVSNPTQAGLPFPVPLASIFGAVDWTTYSPDPMGLLDARRAVAAYLSTPERRFDADHILLTASTSEAYSLAFKAFCDPGDAVAVAVPSYPLISHLLELEGLTPVTFEMRYGERWEIDLDSLQHALSAGARVVVLVAPNNPTGNVPSDASLSAIAALCKRFDVPLLLDTVFAPYSTRASVATRVPEDILSLTLDGLSKSAGLPQLKLGWTLVQGPADLRAETLARLEFVNDAYLSAATPVQRALPEILKHAPRMQESIRARLTQNRAVLARALANHPRLRVLEDDGGWYAVLSLPEGSDEEALCLRLVEHDVLVQPGFLYDFPEGAHLVVSLLTPEEDFAAGLVILAQVV